MDSVAVICLLMGLIHTTGTRRRNSMKRASAIRYLEILLFFFIAYSVPMVSAVAGMTPVGPSRPPSNNNNSSNKSSSNKESNPLEANDREGVEPTIWPASEESPSVSPSAQMNACGLQNSGLRTSITIAANASLTWGKQEVFTPSQRSLTIVNTLMNDTSLCVFQLHSTNPQNFHVLGFEETSLQPRGMLTMHVAFMPRDVDLIRGLLVVHTSLGSVSIGMEGVGVEPAHEIPKAERVEDAARLVGTEHGPQQLLPLCPLGDDPYFRPSIALRVSTHHNLNLGILSDPGPLDHLASWAVSSVISSQLSVLTASKVCTFPDTPVGEHSKQWIQVRNPSGMPISIELLVNSIAWKSMNAHNVDSGVIPCNKTDTSVTDEPLECSTTTDRDPNNVMSPELKGWLKSNHEGKVFSIAGDDDDNDAAKIVLAPHSTGAIGPIVFHPHEMGYNAVWRSNVILLNNLTGIEWMRIEGQSTTTSITSNEPGLVFFDGRKQVDALKVEVDSSSLPLFSEKTLKEKIETFLDEDGAYEACHDRRTSKGFIARNLGNSPVHVNSLMLTGSNGFRVDSFHGFYLAPGESAKLLISYQPDFGNISNTQGDLQLVTAAGDVLSVALRAQIPKDMIWFCERARLLSSAKRIFLQVCVVAAFLVLFVFGKMHKQEGASINEWKLSHTNGLSKFSQDRPNIRHKRPSIYVSIELDCAQGGERKQDCFNLFTVSEGALKIVYSCVNHLSVIKVWITRTILMGAVMLKISSQPDNVNDPHSDCSRPTKSIPPRSISSPLSRPKLSHLRKEKSIMLPDTKVREPVQFPSSSSSSLSKSLEKEKDISHKAGKRIKKRKNLVVGFNSLDHINIDNSSDSSHSPRSTPSSPLIRQSGNIVGMNRPISPLVKASIFSPIPTTALGNEAKNVIDVLQITHESKESISPSKDVDSNTGEHPSSSGCDHGDVDHNTVPSKAASSKSTAASESCNSDLVQAPIKSRPSTSNDESLKTIKQSDLKPSLVVEQLGWSTLNDESMKTTNSLDVRAVTSGIGEDVGLVTISSTNLISTSAMAPHARAPGTRPKLSNTGSILTSTSHDTILTAKPCVGESEDVNSINLGHHDDAQTQYSLNGMGSATATLVTDHKYNMSLYDIWGDHFKVELTNEGRKLESDKANRHCNVPFFSGSFSIFSSPQYPFHVNNSS